MNDLLLLAMMLAGPKYGYQLKREAAWMAGRDALHNNLVYPMLRRLLEEGWVGKKSVPGKRGQTRQQYALTGDGHRYLFERIGQFTDADAASESAFHLRVGLFMALRPEVRELILGRREDYLRGQNEKLATLQDNMELGKFGDAIVRHMRKQVAMNSDWIRHLRRMSKSIGVKPVQSSRRE